METFGYNKAWKGHKFMACGYPILALLAVGAFGLFVVLPSRGDAFRFEFKWWVPLFVIALIVWAILEIRKYKKTLGYSVELTEEFIRVSGEDAKWEDISRIEFRNAGGDDPAIVLQTKTGKALAIAGATASFQYVKGFIEGHAINASRN